MLRAISLHAARGAPTSADPARLLPLTPAMELPVLSTLGDCAICKKPLPWNLDDCAQQYCCGAVTCKPCMVRHVEALAEFRGYSRTQESARDLCGEAKTIEGV